MQTKDSPGQPGESKSTFFTVNQKKLPVVPDPALPDSAESIPPLYPAWEPNPPGSIPFAGHDLSKFFPIDLFMMVHIFCH